MNMPVVTCIPVLLKTQTAAARLVDAAFQCGFEVCLESGCYRVNAKSMLGVLSLDLSKPCYVTSEEDLSTLRSAIADVVCG